MLSILTRLKHRAVDTAMSKFWNEHIWPEVYGCKTVRLPKKDFQKFLENVGYGKEKTMNENTSFPMVIDLYWPTFTYRVATSITLDQSINPKELSSKSTAVFINGKKYTMAKEPSGSKKKAIKLSVSPTKPSSKRRKRSKRK